MKTYVEQAEKGFLKNPTVWSGKQGAKGEHPAKEGRQEGGIQYGMWKGNGAAAIGELATAPLRTPFKEAPTLKSVIN